LSKPLDIIISGVKGRMGQAILSSVEEDPDLNLFGGLEYADHPDQGKPILGNNGPKIENRIEKIAKSSSRSALIEFTSPSATLSHLEECVKLDIPMIIGTTGFEELQLKQIEESAKKIPIVMAPNYSIGINLMAKVIKELASALPESYDLEVIEAHHALKKDAPSGTAPRLGRALAEGRKTYLEKVICLHREGNTGERKPGQIGIQTIRGGDIVGDHTVIFAGPGERIEVTHRAHSRKNFASGALKAAKWLWPGEERRSPTLYDMFDVLELKDL